MRVVVITGSRYWTHQRPIQDAVQGADLVMHGCARGADQIAGMAAQYLQIDELVFRARWKPDGKAAGPRRNERMAAWAAHLRDGGHDVRCYAFPLRESVGTVDCIARMRVHGILTTVFGESEGRS